MEMKRSRLDRIKYFKLPLWKENFYLHNKRMHSSKWTEYCDLDSGANNSFSILSAAPDHR